MNTLVDICLNKIYNDNSYNISVLPQDLICHIIMKRRNPHYKINPLKVYIYEDDYGQHFSELYKKVGLIYYRNPPLYDKYIRDKLIFYTFCNTKKEPRKYKKNILDDTKYNRFIIIKDHPYVSHIIKESTYYIDIISENDIYYWLPD